ncbi:hypothetical protein RN001_010844 [Aquatica leii]|uniref:ditrans,polycis-polyprenyl diphosphate synthase [(2E,6E)-farnesyldiphosphate specific] n=1 Tax=Aquatica leii TaxID=1421715 RepID=A0AAN7SNG4_9COLE|nr:hypothetical protein RN001_010844 [Aquatica leii]
MTKNVTTPSEDPRKDTDKKNAVKFRKAYKSFVTKSEPCIVLRNLNMTVPKGTIYGLVGSSSCGKTTLLNCIIGRRKLDSGELWVLKDGEKVTKPRIGFMPQQTALYQQFTIWESMRHFGWLIGMSTQDITTKVKDLVESLELPDITKKINTLDHNHKKLVSFAIVLLLEPELLILDEPTVGLDPLVRHTMWKRLKQLTRKCKATVIFTTHYIDEVKDADLVGFMRNGRLMVEDPPRIIMSRFHAVTLEKPFWKLSAMQDLVKVNHNKATFYNFSLETDYRARYKVGDHLTDKNRQHWKVHYDSEHSAKDSVLSGKTYASILIKENYTRELRTRLDNWQDASYTTIFGSTIYVFKDPSKTPISGFLKMLMVDTFMQYISDFLHSCLIQKNEMIYPFQWNPPLRDLLQVEINHFTLPGVFLASMFLFSASLAAITMSMEKNEGTFDRGISLGVCPLEMLYSHLFTDLVVTVLVCFPTFGVMAYIFGIKLFPMPTTQNNRKYPVVCVKRAYKHFGDGKKPLVVLDNLDMTVPKGVIYGLLGPSGCGKTTLLNCIIGRMKLNSGDVRISQATIGYMPQEIALYKEFSIRETMKYFGWIAGMNTKDIYQKLDFLAKLLMIPDVDAKIKNLSGGQQRRVSFVTTLLHEPDLLVLDEPTVGLDPILREVIWNHLIFLTKNQQVTVIISSHYIEETRQANVIGLMRESYIVAEEQPQELLCKLNTNSLEDAFLKLSLLQNERSQEKRYTFGSVGKVESVLPNTVMYYAKNGREQLQHLKAILWKNLLWMMRNLPLMASIVALPAVIITLFCISYGHHPYNFDVAVINYETNRTMCGTLQCDSTRLSCHYLEYLEKRSFNLLWCNSEEEANALVFQGKAYAAVVVRKNYSSVIKSRIAGILRRKKFITESPSMDVVNDESVIILKNYIKKAMYESFNDLLNQYVEACNETSQVLTVPIMWNPAVYGFEDAELTNFASPGITLTLIFIFSAAMSACSLLIERNEGILERSLIMGVKSVELLVSHIICDTCVLICQIVLILICGFVVFGLALQGSILLVFTLCLLTGFCGMSFGFALSSTLNNETTAVHIITGLATPLVLLSGIVWPIEAMHKILKVFSSVFPLTVATESLRSILQRGWNLSESHVYLGFIYISLLTVVFLACSIICLKIRKALVLIEVLKCGHLPEHVAIILDGNRRYAKLRNKPSHYGHTIGGNKLKVILDWCQIIGIKEITVYAFSIENFKRSKEEVDEVFDLIENLVIDCVNNHPETMLRLVGNLELLPQYLKKSLSQYSLKSIGDKPFVVNLAIAYTARDEITNAINLINEGIKNGCLLLDDIDEDLLNQCLYVQSEPDILLRTSGEKRLSDFLLWQLQSAQCFFELTGTMISFVLILMCCECLGKERLVPKNLSIGSATSAYQVEGAWNEQGKGESIWDKLVHTQPNRILDRSTGDVAADSYHNYKDDVSLMKNIGFQHYRFSISWTRLLPNGFSNFINPDGVNYYNNLIDELLTNGIVPIVTLYHFDLPQSLQDLGGWANAKIVKWFADYSQVVFKLFGDKVKTWVTINEPKQICSFGYGGTYGAPALGSNGIGEYLCARNVLMAHATVYHVYQKLFKKTQNGRISITVECAWTEPGSNQTSDIKAADRRIQFDFGLYTHPIYTKSGDFPPIVRTFIDNRSKLEKFSESRLPVLTPREVAFIRGTYDFFGLNYYTSFYAKDKKSDPIDKPSLQKDSRVEEYQDPKWLTGSFEYFRSVPWGFRKLLNYIKNHYGDPIVIITENGFPDDKQLDDCDRITYFKDTLGAMLDAMTYDHVRVEAYTAWTLIDNFEWSLGYTVSFGLHHVDFTNPNRTRTPKLSTTFFKNLIATRTLN